MKKTFEEFVGDTDAEVDSFIDTLFDEEPEVVEPIIEPEMVTQETLEPIVIENDGEYTAIQSESTETMPTSGLDDPYEEQFQFFMANLDEDLKPLVESFLFMDGEFVTFSIETNIKKRGKALERCRERMQRCFDGKTWNGKPIEIEVLKKQ